MAVPVAKDTKDVAPPKPFMVTLGPHGQMIAEPKVFSTTYEKGPLTGHNKTGWGVYGKTVIDGETYQVSGNIIKLSK